MGAGGNGQKWSFTKGRLIKKNCLDKGALWASRGKGAGAFTVSFEKTSIKSYCIHIETSRQPVKIKVRFNM